MQEESNRNKKYDLEKRLIDFAVRIIDLVETLANTRASNQIAGQLVRCGTSPAPNYGEAQSAESRNDFIHKVKIAIKELRETKIWLQIIHRKRMARSGNGSLSLHRRCIRGRLQGHIAFGQTSGFKRTASRTICPTCCFCATVRLPILSAGNSPSPSIDTSDAELQRQSHHLWGTILGTPRTPPSLSLPDWIYRRFERVRHHP